MMQYNWLESAKFIAEGIVLTAEYTLISVMLGFLLALLLAWVKLSHIKYLNKLTDIYVSIFRGTPLLVQLSIVYFGIPMLFAVQISGFVAGVIAFSMNSAAYLAEVIRAGIQAIDKGQFEAAHVLQIPRWQTWKDIILPQAIRHILPALMNELISLLKETALISTIGEADIMRRAQLVAAEQYTYLEPLLIAALYYYLMIWFLTTSAKRVERMLQYD